MYPTRSLRKGRPAPVLALLLFPLVAGSAAAQSPPAVPPATSPELTKLRAEVLSLRQQLAQKEQALGKANADIGTMRAEVAGDRAALTRAQAELTNARKALADADAARTILRRDLAAEQAAHQAKLVKAREEATAATKALTEAIRARDKAVQDLAAVAERAARVEKQCEQDRVALSGAREKLRLAEAEMVLMHQELEKGRLHISDVSFPSAQNGRARFVIEVPAPDVRLYVDGKRLDVIDGKVVREFTSTPLDTGKRYTLSLKAEMTRDGKVLSTTRQVIFKADHEYRLYLDPRTAMPSASE